MNNTLYMKSTDDLRPFLELAGYGCYSRQQMKTLLEKSATYDKRIEFLNVCLSPDYWHYSRKGKERRFAFHDDAYRTKKNELIPIFSMKSLDLQWLLCYLAILSILNQPNAGKGFSYSQIEREVMQLLYDLLLPCLKNIPFKNAADWKKQLATSPQKNDAVIQLALQVYHENWGSQIRRRLQDLVRTGLVNRVSKGKENEYSLPDKITLLPAGQKELTAALPLFASTALLSLPGWYLTQRYAKSLTKKSQTRYVNALRISSDSQLYTLLLAIRKQKNITFTYRNRPHEGFPLQVRTDAYQREYLEVYEENRVITYRISRMNQIQLQKGNTKPEKIPFPSKQHIILRLHYDNRNSFHRLTDAIWRQCPDALVTQVKGNTAQCILKTNNNRSKIPWLRTLYPQVEIVDDSTGHLRERVRRDLKEALQNYGITV